MIAGAGLDGMRAPAAPIDCGNSGTTIRLLCGLLAGQRFASTLFGDESLSNRPMRRVIEPLAAMGASITGQGSGLDDTPPLVVGPAAGPLAPIDYALPMASAQVKTAILLAGLFAGGQSADTEPGPSRDHSACMLAYLGASLAVTGRRTSIDTRGWDRRRVKRILRKSVAYEAKEFAGSLLLHSTAGEIERALRKKMEDLFPDERF